MVFWSDASIPCKGNRNSNVDSRQSIKPEEDFHFIDQNDPYETEVDEQIIEKVSRLTDDLEQKFQNHLSDCKKTYDELLDYNYCIECHSVGFVNGIQEKKV